MTHCPIASFPLSQLFKNFVTALNKTPAGPERKVLEQVCRLYGLWQVELEAAQFLSSGYFGKEHLAKIQTEVSFGKWCWTSKNLDR